VDPRAFTHAAGTGAQLATACTRLLKLTNRLLEQLSRAKVRPGHFRGRENSPAGQLCRVAQTAAVPVQVTQIELGRAEVERQKAAELERQRQQAERERVARQQGPDRGPKPKGPDLSR